MNENYYSIKPNCILKPVRFITKFIVIKNKFLKFLILLVIISFTIKLKAQPSDFLKGRAFEIKNQFDSAIFFYSKFLEKNDNDDKAYMARGHAYYQQGNITESINDYNKASKLNDDIADFGLAQCYAQQGDLKQSLYWLSKHLTSRYKQPQVIVRLDKAFLRFENYPEWKSFWSKDWYNKYESQVGEARFMLNNQDCLGVINFTSDILKHNSRNHELYYYRAKAFHEMGNYNTAVNDYNKAIDIYKRNCEYFEGRAESLLKLNKNNEALIDFNSAINIAPDNFYLYLKRAGLYLSIGKFDLAKTDIDLYLSLFENDSTALFLAGKVAFANGNYFNALIYFNRLINSYPKTSKYFLSRAEIYEKTNMVQYALKDYNTCLYLEPANIVALRKRGRLLLVVADKKTACNDLKKAMNAGDFEANNLFLDNCK